MSQWKPDPERRNMLGNTDRKFALVVLPLIERFGDEAKEIIYKTIYEAGLKKGRSLAAKAKDTNDLLEMERLFIQSMADKGYNIPGFDDPARTWIVKTKHKCSYNLSKAENCEHGIPEVWKEMGLDDETIRMLGEISCVPGDTGVRKGFNPKMEFKFTKLVTRGDPYCEWYEEIKE